MKKGEKKVKKEERKIKAIIFDIGGVLELGKYSSHPKHLHKLLGFHNSISKKLGISLDQWFDAIDTTYAKSITGELTEKKVIKTISKNVNISEKKFERLAIKLYKKQFKENKPLFKLALKLKKQGYKIAILSDQWHLSKKALIKPKLTKKFDAVVVSCDVGMRKPNPKIYKLCLKKLNVPAKNCLFIDNQKWNILPAKKLGMQTILYKENKQLFKQLSKKLK